MSQPLAPFSTRVMPRSLDLLLAILVLATTLLTGTSVSAQQGEACPTVDCETNPQACSNYPFQPTECWTTDAGPAKADIVTEVRNFLRCETGTYALCYFSGPWYPTGASEHNPPLPCTLNTDGETADCTCEEFRASAEMPYYVVIHSILNLGVYNETVAACGPEGDGCRNMLNCADPDSALCKSKKIPPVCQYVAAQDPDHPKGSLFPEADLISTFSFAMGTPKPGQNYRVASTPCEGSLAGLYGGCMTAPCEYRKGPSGAKQVHCACPTFSGDFQIGQGKATLEAAARKAGAGTSDAALCQPGEHDGERYVWSAANVMVDIPAPDSNQPFTDEAGSTSAAAVHDE